MKLHRALLVVFCLVCLVGVAYVNQATEGAGIKMTTSAQKLFESLTAEQKAKAAFEFDDKERTNWHFVPLQDKDKKPTRKGLPLGEMSGEQQKMAMDLVKTGTSADGYAKATAIMSLELVLRDLEKGGAMVRDPGWYFFSLFGTPSKTGRWGWRVEGHHLALNFVIDSGKVISATPTFFGANPAVMKRGPKIGERNLPEAEDRAKELLKSLTDEQLKIAQVDKQFEEIEQAKAGPTLGMPIGLAAEKMTEKQRSILQKLIESYASRLPEDIAVMELGEAKEAGIEKVHFAYAGPLEEGKPHSYRVHGPTFVIEFLNVQADSGGNPANHIHSCWRSMKGDFGLQAK
ncbi:MAG TPA: DUF3500 domain-containing protein [Gemmataceae bacterium]|nr:DUF3500 domain-containing protein [Gemmataceae bacterium]